MPVTVSKSDGGYRVSTPHGVHAKNASLKNAMAQKRLLNAVDHGWRPSGGKAKKPQQSEKALKTMAMKARSIKHKA